ncbi:MAG: SCO family protein [Alphaproteobacteria bacterium]|nr:SCO family protein [Alphaproteobacteria bacterium]
MRWSFLPLALLGACSIFAGDTVTVHAVVVEVGQTSVQLDHSGAGALEPGVAAFVADPNLARRLSPGDRVTANLLLAHGEDQARIIGVEVTGHEAPPTPVEGPVALEIGETLPAVRVPGIDGELLIGEGQGTPTVLTFLFTTCPSPNFCPLLASKLARLQGEIQGEGRIISVTLDPETDSLDVLRAYAEARGADPEVWTFGRLEEPEMMELLRQAGLTRVVKTKGDILHSLHILVLNAEGVVVYRGNDNSWDEAEVAEAVKR